MNIFDYIFITLGLMPLGVLLACFIFFGYILYKDRNNNE
ncbi:hypothetical protein UFOVP1_38 [uncultured Caudovirales phage]|uniref:Uncharacterized protein n=1 Tax=uncultured Caudovirales phage TaxID=2100421 RepID=A0A6J5KJA1_9CAUD|nr:hypothetical protein UFOVP1_38 [uncultured Caudovirales phage]